MQSNTSEVELRIPTATDGPALSKLVSLCPPLDENSRYCNLLQVSHFADTAVVADLDGELVGAITGYLRPGHPDTLFIWQVAVLSKMRGQRLAKRMVMHLLQRPQCADVRYIETTVTPDNKASWGLFEGIARDLNAPLNKSVLFERNAHFAGAHDDEMLCRIGPFTTPSS
ncbi:diaminobutyrate acetyltransferase [Gilvimarinus sp. F26214L]|uniref:diaminobutyrate acetyltransferase n=1 Tax=Gilvimarinus sp. DZF01 TaxID=3461371 RepID=UPI0040466423